MDQDIEIITAQTRIEKIKSFFVNNKKKLFLILVIIILLLFGFFFYSYYKLKKKEDLANIYNFEMYANQTS